MNILSISSHVAYGHVGNSAAVFAMRRLGAEVWPVDTVAFSNHPGHGRFTGRVVAPAEVAALVEGIGALGLFARCDGVLSGYVGDAGTGPVVVDAATRVKDANPAALFCCDPVLGDAGAGIYVRAGIPEFMRDRMLPLADILTPNRFELEYLSGRAVATRDDLVAAMRLLLARGPRAILVTSADTTETPRDAADVVACGSSRAWLARAPRLAGAFNGAGDTMAALFLVHYLRSRSVPEALSASVSAIHGVLRRTAEAGERELLLVEAQDELVAPSRVFGVEAIAAFD
jgi:pyridoxine kinase